MKYFLLLIVFFGLPATSKNQTNSNVTVKLLLLYLNSGYSKLKPNFISTQPLISSVQGLSFQTIFKSFQYDEASTPLSILNSLCNNLQVRKSGVNAVMLMSGEINVPIHMIRYIIHLTASMGLPTLTWLPNQIGKLKHEETMMTLHLEPAVPHVAEAMFDFLRTYNWNNAVLLLSTKAPDYAELQEEIRRISNNRKEMNDENEFKLDITQVIYYDGITKLNDVSKIKNMTFLNIYRQSLEKIVNSNDRIILFHGFKLDFSILYYAAEVFNLTKIFGADYVWILSPSGMPQTDYKNIREMEKELYLRMEFIKISGMPGLFGFTNVPFPQKLEEDIQKGLVIWASAVTKLFNKRRNVDATNKWLLPKFNCRKLSNTESWKYGKLLYKAMKKSITNINGRCIKFLENGHLNETQFEIFNSKFVKKDNISHWFKVGSWRNYQVSPNNRIIIDGVTWPGMSNKPPLGRPAKYKLKVATLAEMPFVIYGKPQDDKTCDENAIPCQVKLSSFIAQNINDKDKIYSETLVDHSNDSNMTFACCAGLAMDLLKELMKDLKFDVDLFEVSGHNSHIGSPEHGWNGLIKSLVDHKSDMVVTSLKITPNRTELIDFSVPFQETGIGILIKLREGAISPTAFLKPYDSASWCVIFIFSVHSCGTAIFIYEWLSPHGLDRGNIPPREHRFSLFRSLWLIWSMLFGAAVNADNPRGVASRFLASIWALFALVFLASYTANLAAFMISKEDFYNLEGLNDWRLTSPYNHKPSFRFTTIPNGATEENIKMDFPEMAQYMKNFNKTSVSEAIKALKAQEIDAFVYDANVLDHKVATDKDCKLRVVGRLYAMTGYGVGLPRGSKMLKNINSLILSYQKTGKLQRWKKFWMSGACKKHGELANTNKKLGVKNFISAFILLLGGMILSFVLLISEHCFFRYMRPRVRSCDKYGCCGLVSLSMGQLLSFEQSVNQTVDMLKNFKCRNPMCESQVERLKKALDLSQTRIKQLENEVVKLRRNNNKSQNTFQNLNKFTKKFQMPLSNSKSVDENDLASYSKSNFSKVYKQTLNKDNYPNLVANSYASEISPKRPLMDHKQYENPICKDIFYNNSKPDDRVVMKESSL